MAYLQKKITGLQVGFEDILDTTLSGGFALEDAGLASGLTLKPVVNATQSTITTFAPITRFDLSALGNG
ncbi:MAG: hypothetical protein L3J05_02670, partial [Robiginitomaculum sp.]|nr:hypothetical protein [Robiginitomaculum sp.]